MADIAAAKLAAGRKMLKEFQNKKKIDPIPTGLFSTDQNSLATDVSSNATAQHNTELDTKTNDGQKISVETEYPSNIIDYDNNSNSEYPTLDLPGMINSASINPVRQEMPFKAQDNIGQVAAANFFDRLSSDNNMWPNQSTNSAVENGVPLAGVLFSNQHKVSEPPPVQPLPQSLPGPSTVNTNSEAGKLELKKETSHATNDNSSEGSAEGVQDMKTRVEISKLQQQLQFHVKTVEFLVSEKSELLEKVNEYEKLLSEGKSGSEDLGGRLNTSRQRASHLEMEVKTLKKQKKEAEDRAHHAHELGAIARANEGMLRNQVKDLEEEVEEYKTILNDKISENKNLSKKIEELNQLISNPLRFQDGSPNNQGPLLDPQLAEKYLNLQELVESLQEQVSELETDKSESSIQYQEYVRQLNQQIQAGNVKHADLAASNEKLAYREIELVRQMSNLEKQMQTLRSQLHKEEEKVGRAALDTPTLESLRLVTAENDQLKSNLLGMEYSLRSTKEELMQSRSRVEELSQTIQQVQSEKPDSAKLNAAMESDKLAAQKATAQNTKMKLDLQHLEKAFEQMTNSKLELAELLQAEKNLSKTLTLKLVETEETLKETRSHLRAKDEEMIRLQAASSDLQKEVLKQAQVADRLSHYEAQGQSSEILQSELQTTQSAVQTLAEENEKLKKSLLDKDIPESHSDCNHHHHHHSEVKEEATHTSNVNPANIPTDEAMTKLQERFTKLMQEVAELSDEKQKLEHIVLQLQGETETICEYIALYQKQRGVLKQRELERNNQIDVLSKEREHIKAQLESLRGLITEFVPANSNLLNGNHNDSKTQTAEKIMSLLTEIKGSHLIEPSENCGGLESFHPCPCCSGKLIIV